MKLFSQVFFLLASLLFFSNSNAAPENNNLNNTWEGTYFGLNVGGIFATFKTPTSTTTGELFDPSQVNLVNQIGRQSIDADGFITGIQAGYHWQMDNLVLGLETDLQAMSLSNSKISGPIPYPNLSEGQFVISAYANANWLWTLRPKIGVSFNHSLAYVTGGIALTKLQSDFIFTDNFGAFESQRARDVKPGFVLGAGIASKVTNRTSVRGEYLIVNFDRANASLMSQFPRGQDFSNSSKLKTSIFRIGMDYNFNPDLSDNNERTMLPTFLDPDLYQFEIGTRLFVSSGRVGAPQPLFNSPGKTLASRLIFSDLDAVSAETYARIDHQNGLFAKGYLGAGSILNGQLNDEDFPAGGAYSNTYSSASGNLSYFTIDVGYDLFKTEQVKVGTFLGYNHNPQHVNVYGCRQLAGALVCARPPSLENLLGISENDRYNSLRIGLTSRFELTDRLHFDAEAAYLPLVNFEGQDDHNARALIGPEYSSNGDGVMLEAALKYQLDAAWSLGVGARYWTWNMHDGSVVFDFLGEPETFTEPARYNTERYGMFVQLEYRSDQKPHLVHFSPVNWQGLYVGGYLGGAFGESRFSDSFASTPAEEGLMNVAGFGNKIHVSGPLAGLNLELLWQHQQWVYGLGANLSALDGRGEDTLFSGLGGVNGEIITRKAGTIFGKVGMTVHQTLLYLTGGSAFLDTKFHINGNTSALSLGSESQQKTLWGYTIGTGILYAINNQWSTQIEYQYIHVPRQHVAFSGLEFIQSQNLKVKQTLNLFNLGINYKFNFMT